MPAVWIQKPLAPQELTQLKEEFPDYDYLVKPPEDWAELEVLYGAKLTIEELHRAHRLRWIHIPSASLGNLPIKEIEETSNLLVSNTKDPDVHCFAEYAMGAILSSSKHFFISDMNPDTLWSIKGKILLQIGLGQVGNAILEQAESFGMRTWGIEERASFHNHCEKTFSMRDLHSLLPAIDVLSLAIPRGAAPKTFLGSAEFNLMKSDSILLILGSEGAFHEEELAQAAETQKFRSIFYDAPPEKTAHSPLRDKALLTPAIANLPSSGRRLEFHQFQYNFRRYARNEFDGMKNLVRGT